MALFKKNYRTIWAKLSLIFIGFILLVSASVFATSLALKRQANDILVADMVSHQSVHINNIARAILGLQVDLQQDKYFLDLIELDLANSGFGDTQYALLYGGEISYGNPKKTVSIPPTELIEIISVLEDTENYQNILDEAVQILLNSPTTLESSRAITSIETQVPMLYQQINQLSILFQLSANRNLTRLRSIQIVFFLSAISLLVWGYLSVKNTILEPLQTLDKAAQQIAAGKLDNSVSLSQQDEIGALARSFEIMRKQVHKANQISDAMAESLEERVDLRTKQLSALLDINADIASKRDIDGVLHSVTDTAKNLLNGKVSVICLLDEGNQNLSVASCSGPESALKQTQAKIEEGILTDVIDHGKIIQQAACKDCPILSETMLEDVVIAPMQIGQAPIGAVCVADSSTKDRGENENNARVLSFLANSASNALENARLFNHAETAATLAERERMAAEMHDGLAQTLGYLNLKTDQALYSLEHNQAETTKEELDLMRPAIQSAYNTVRHWLSGLSDDGLSQNNLGRQLEDHIEDFKIKTGLKVNLSIDPNCASKISEEEKVQLFRVAQECLTNVFKHAEASEIEVSIASDSKTIAMSISDDGKGFDPLTAVEDAKPHLGLKIMRGRVERVGGSLTVQSHLNQGTQIIARVPFI
ncbi:MAG: histidine kinase [Chloroflexota bacterium]